MSVIRQIEDKGATCAWSPLPGSSMIALGTKDSAGLDDYGGELDIYDLDIGANRDSPTTPVGTFKEPSRFTCLAWGYNGPSGMGIIAGGLQSNVVNLWDPAKLASGSLATIKKHQGNVNCLQFNPHKPTAHLLATGGSDNEVFIVDTSKPNEPTIHRPMEEKNAQRHSRDVLALAWNSEVSHILASASMDGTCFVWSLKDKKRCAEIRDPSGAGFSAVAWNPTKGLHLMTASNDDRNPVLRLWDVRSSSTTPLAEYRGHTASITSISWCKADPMYVLSCARDGRTIFWDLFTGQPAAEFGGEAAAMGAGGGNLANGFQGVYQGYGHHPETANQYGLMRHGNSGIPGSFYGDGGDIFGGDSYSGMSSNRAVPYEVQFSPNRPTLFASCSSDRTVKVLSVDSGCGGARNAVNLAAFRGRVGNPEIAMRSPAWTKRHCGASFGFGGKLLSFGDFHKKEAAGAHGSSVTKGHISEMVRMSRYQDDTDLLSKVVEWDQIYSQAMATIPDPQDPQSENPFLGLCNHKASLATRRWEKEAWKSLSLRFESNPRERILQHLGYDLEKVSMLFSSMDITSTETSALAEQADSNFVGKPHLQETDGTSAEWFNQPTHELVSGSEIKEESEQSSERDINVDGTDSLKRQESGFSGSGPPEAVDSMKRSTPIKRPSSQASQQPKTVSKNIDWENVESIDVGVDDTIKMALLTGNIPAAINSCLENNRFAEALLFASTQDGEIWNRTMETYINKFYAKKPYIPILHALMQPPEAEGMITYVQRSDLSGDLWKEVLALSSQYCVSEQFETLCGILGSRIENERNPDFDSLSIVFFCYLCANDLEKVVSCWERLAQLDADGEQYVDSISFSQTIFEMVSVLLQVLPPEQANAASSMPTVAKQFVNLGETLASAGCFEYAAKYLAYVDMTVLDATPSTAYDSAGQLIEIPNALTEAELSHNVQAQRALRLSDRIFGAYPGGENDLMQYLPVRPVAFASIDVGIAPSNTPIYDNVGSEFVSQPEQPVSYSESSGTHPLRLPSTYSPFQQSRADAIGFQEHPANIQYQQQQTLASPYQQPAASQFHQLQRSSSTTYQQQQQVPVAKYEQPMTGQFQQHPSAAQYQQPQQSSAAQYQQSQQSSAAQLQQPQQSPVAQFQQQQQPSAAQFQQQQQPSAAQFQQQQQPSAAQFQQQQPSAARVQQQQQPSTGQFQQQQQPTAAQYQQKQPPPVQYQHQGNAQLKKPSIDLNGTDGFGSTAGNASAGQKYGNLSGSSPASAYAAAVPGVQHDRATIWNPSVDSKPSMAKPVTQQPSAPPVQRVMPPQMAPVIQILDSHYAALNARLSTMADRKKLHDVCGKSIESLREKLLVGDVPADLFPEISQLIKSVAASEFDTANNVRTALTQRAIVWANHKSWLKGMATLIQLSRK